MIERKTGDLVWYEDPETRKIVWHTQMQMPNGKSMVVSSELPFAVLFGIAITLWSQDANHELIRRKAGDMSDGELMCRKPPLIATAKEMPADAPRPRVSIDPFTDNGKP
jgi:hypothetical protein